MSAFVTQITTALTVGELRGQIDGVDDLYGKTVGKTSSQSLTAQSINHRTFDSLDALYEAIEEGGWMR